MHLQKRKRAIEAASETYPQPQPPAKRPKPLRQSRSRTPPEFWDNLSQVPLCRRALREFNRRTNRPVAPKPPVRSTLSEDLTKQLKRFARHGGPNIRDIRGYPEVEIEAVCKVSSSRSRSGRSRKGTQTDPSNTTSRTRPTTCSSKDPAFQQAIIDAHYYPNNRGPKASDWEEIQESIAQLRPSLSPSRFSDGAFENLQLKNDEAASEGTVMWNVFPIILGRETMPSGDNYAFNNLEPLADNISNPKPDYFNGSRPTQVHPNVRKDLGKYIIPSSDDSRPLLPNFFAEAKGPTGNAAQMKLQITQDLAYGARGMHKTQSYGQDQPMYDGNTYTYGATYHSGTSTLQLYGMHPTEPADPDGEPEYHTTQLTAFALTANPQQCRQGIGAFRNLQDLAKEKRDRLITYANEVAARQLRQEQQQQDEDDDDEEEEEEVEEDSAILATQYIDSFTSPSQASTQIERSLASDMALPDSDTSTDELQRDYNPPAKCPSKSSHCLQRRKRRSD